MSQEPKRGPWGYLVAAGLIFAGLCVTGGLFLNGSIGICWGTLSSAKETYLDGTPHMFQKGSWHIGNGTRTWGETYGVKINRFYLTFGVTHVNRAVSPKQANESD